MRHLTLFVLQVDLGVLKTVRGIITQGARGLEGSTSADNRAFVRKYKLAHSLNGKDWSYVIDSKTGFAKVNKNAHYHAQMHAKLMIFLLRSLSFPIPHKSPTDSPLLFPFCPLSHYCFFCSAGKKNSFIPASPLKIIAFNHLSPLVSVSASMPFFLHSFCLSSTCSLIPYLSLMGVN